MDKKKRIAFLKEVQTAEEYQKIEQDKKAFKTCLEMYDEEYIDSVQVYAVNNKRFIVSKEDVPKLPVTWADTSAELSLVETLENPVYVEIDTDGILLIE